MFLRGAVLAGALVLGTGAALADDLTRDKCWTVTIQEKGSWRTVCLFWGNKATMRNHNTTSDNKGWSRCEWTGHYTAGEKVKIDFDQGSGTCSNGAQSPQWSVTCDFDGKALDCAGSSMVDGKNYPINLLFE